MHPRLVPEFEHGDFGPMATRDILSEMGVRPTIATMVTPALFWTPGESDPSAQTTLFIVQGVQKVLRRTGYDVKVDGRMDAATQNAIAERLGPRWWSIPWVHIYSVIRRKTIYSGMYGPKKQVTWEPEQTTAIGELMGPGGLGLGATETPKDTSYPIPPTLPLSGISCLDSGTCYGNQSVVTRAFQELQVAVGVAVDGKIGSGTASKTATRLQNLIDNRTFFKVSALDYTQAAIILGFYRKYQKPYALAVYADQIVRLLTRYGADARKTPVVQTTAPPLPEVTMGGFGTGWIAVAGLGILGIWALAGRKGGKGGKRRSRRRR